MSAPMPATAPQPTTPAPEKFYVVWCPEHGPFKVRHPALHFAEREAARLALANPGEIFFVLSAKSVSLFEEQAFRLQRLRRRKMLPAVATPAEAA